MNASEIQSVRDTLQKFQDGYQRRDVNRLAEFRDLFVKDDDLEVIGASAVEPGGEEWCLGLDAASGLFENDWEDWGDLTLDVGDARIHVLGDAAWLATTGSVAIELDPVETYRNFFAYAGEVAAQDRADPRARLLELLRNGTNTLCEAEQGRQYIWPLRFTAVLVRQSGTWLFHQVQFSFATTRYPDVRI